MPLLHEVSNWILVTRILLEKRTSSNLYQNHPKWLMSYDWSHQSLEDFFFLDVATKNSHSWGPLPTDPSPGLRKILRNLSVEGNIATCVSTARMAAGQMSSWDVDQTTARCLDERDVRMRNQMHCSPTCFGDTDLLQTEGVLKQCMHHSAWLPHAVGRSCWTSCFACCWVCLLQIHSPSKRYSPSYVPW